MIYKHYFADEFENYIDTDIPEDKAFYDSVQNDPENDIDWFEECESIEPKIFVVGKVYYKICWFTAGRMEYTVEKRTKNTITFSVIDEEIDGTHKRNEKYKIDRDENGNESVFFYEYYGCENRMYA